MRLGMDRNVPTSTTEVDYLEILTFGPFDLQFAAQLLSFIRDDQMKKQPPLQNNVIGMPSQSKLLAATSVNGTWLHEKICEFGGYENVARRLGLAFA